ncbi:MAG: hypothetical protein FJY17_00105 [Bacteroidetes bacterium]|nr:hypothetical protein [Bacteroidota bacterium]
MALDALQITRTLLAYQVVNDKESLVKLLKRNGVEAPINATDTEITSAALFTSGKSPNFKKELAALLAGNAKSAGQEFASFVGQEMDFTGLDDFSFTGMEGFENQIGKPAAPPRISATPTAAVTTATAAKKKDKTGAGRALASIGGFFKDNILTRENVDTAVQIGLTKINTKTQNKANQVAQEGLVIQQYQDDIRNQQGSKGKGGLGTGAWVAIGLGVAAIVGIGIFFAIRKK